LLALVSALHACSPTPHTEPPKSAVFTDAAPASESNKEAVSAPARDAGTLWDSAAPAPDAGGGRPGAAQSQAVGDAASTPREPERDAASTPPEPEPGAACAERDASCSEPVRDDAAADAWVFQPDASLRNAGARRTIVSDIPEAENLFFTEDGRLFVSGGPNVFEIKRDAAGAFSKTDLFEEDCVVEGITHANGHIYGVCTKTDPFGEAYLLGGALTAQPHMQIIGRLDDLGIPNGMDADRHGNLYTTYSGKGSIAKLVLSEPLKLSRIEVWSKENLPAVNGLRFVGEFVYFTVMNAETLTTRFGRMPLQADGSPGRAEFLLARGLALFDDVGAFEGGFMIAEYMAGRLLFFRDGKVLAETPDETFYAPSSAAQGRPPMFRENQVLVTEKGLLGVTGETDGDRLSVFEL
jgi:hypothetical protein